MARCYYYYYCCCCCCCQVAFYTLEAVHPITHAVGNTV